MEEEIFKTEREFNFKFGSKFYICSNCEKLIQNKYECEYCGWRADGLFKTMGKGYRYKIIETGAEEEIFMPVEIQKGK